MPVSKECFKRWSDTGDEDFRGINVIDVREESVGEVQRKETYHLCKQSSICLTGKVKEKVIFWIERS